MKQRSLKTLMLLVLCCMISMTAIAQKGGKKVTMVCENEPLTQALRAVERLSGYYKINYSYDELKRYTVTATIQKQPAPDAVKVLLRGLPYTSVVQGRFISVQPKKGTMEEAVHQHLNSTVEGVAQGLIVDSNREPLPYVTIRVVGRETAAISNIDGRFYIKDVSPNDILEFSYVGMATVRHAVGKKPLTVIMKEDNVLEDVVVTGIFRKAKESYTGAVSTIDKEQLEMYRGKNLVQTLKNIDASINFPVNNIAGSNPNVLPNLNIRGSSSLPMSVEEFNQNAAQTVNAPLIILDGFEISLTKLMDYNDEQIESINILKDAAATAIYGSRGANGVIVIVTKQPEKGKLKTTVRAGLTLEIPDLSSYHLLNAEQKLQLEKIAGLYTNVKNPTQQYFLDGFYNERLKAVKEGTDIDWMSKPLRNGVGQRYNISLDGGSEEFRWGASLGYNGIAGAMKGSDRKTVNGDITLMYSVKNLIFRNYTSLSVNNANESPYGSFQNYVDQEPYNNPYDSYGNLVTYFWDMEHKQKVGNPLYDATLNTINKSDYLSVMNNFSVEWVILEGLRLRGTLGISTNRGSSDVFLPPSHSTFNSTEYSTAAGQLRKGRYTYSNSTSNMYSGNLTMSYSKVFFDKHQIYVGLNYNITQSDSKNYGFVGEGYSNDDLSTPANSLQYLLNGSPSGTNSKNRMVGITGNANYTFDNRYYIDLSYRTDGNSKFGSENRFAPFWSVGLGWNIHNEKFLRDNKTLSSLRLKASYGLTGSQDISTENIYTTYRYQAGHRYIGWTAATLMGLGNKNLTWQKTNELNIGLEFGLFNHRITGQVDVYSKKTNNLLSSMDLPLSTGFSSYTSNVGELKNNGFEASLNAYIIRDYKRKFNWMIGGQIVYDWNEISHLSDAILEQNEQYLAQNVEVSNLFYVGRPLNAIYAVRSKGIDPSTGDELYITKNGDITTNWKSSDEVYLGSSQPLYRGNLNTTVMYKNFTVNIAFNYRFGGKMYNSTLSSRVEVSKNVIAQKNVDERVLNARWINPGDVVFFRNFNDNYSSHATSRYVFDENVLELASVNVQYRWNSKWLINHTPLQSILFAVNLSDIAHWSSVRYERGTGYPYARNIQGSLTFNF
ncbi:MAG: SusC/RagA family TonB-linked outer membrane protein [Prevotella sp.]|nr:SusC/RagA family TonB-linked outer membrane protein [Prevotella sp.]